MEQDKMKEDSVIRVENLSYTYEGNDRKALDGISLEIGRGRKVAFMGGNGSGKSTFFLCLNGLLRPREGRILIDGQPIRYTRKGLLESYSRSRTTSSFPPVFTRRSHSGS